MSRSRTALLLICLPTLLPGCAGHLAALQGDLESRLDRWVAEEEYGRALDALVEVRNSDLDTPELAARQRRIEQQADSYAREMVLRAEALAEAGAWQQAWALYQQALERLPDHPRLIEGHQRFRDRQQRALARVELNLLLARGDWLAEALPLLTERARVAGDDPVAQQELAETQALIRETARALSEQGNSALKARDLTLARRALTLAHRLAPGPESRAARQQVERQLANQSRAKARRESAAASEKRREEVRETLAAFEAAYGHGELLEAQRLLERLKRLNVQDPRIQALDRGLEEKVGSQVEQHLMTGSSLYSSGQFEQAVEEWRRALALDPENVQARANLERGERVLERLRELREKQRADPQE